jgi:hypothetical protein
MAEPESPLRKISLLTSLPEAPLMPFDATGRFEQAIPFAFADYLELVDTVETKGQSVRRHDLFTHTRCHTSPC